MSLLSENNKENFRLLDLSSDEESEDLHLEIIPSRKKKMSRKERNRGATVPKSTEPNIRSEVRCAVQWALRGTLLLWLMMLTWMCAALYDQVTDMQIQVHKVITSSNSVGDALQNCHSMTKELRANASDLSARLISLEYKHREIALKVDKAAADLAKVTEKLSAEPLLADTPRRLADLQRTVAYFGSQINGFDDALNSARKQAATAASGVEETKTLIHALEAKTNETVANVSASAKKDDELRQAIAALNTTLAGKVEALQTRIEQMSVKTSTVPPSTSSTSTTTASTTSSTNTTTQPPGPPAKPFVLH